MGGFGLPVNRIRNREVAGGIAGADRDHTDPTRRDDDDRPVCPLFAARNGRARSRYDVAFGTHDTNEDPFGTVRPTADAGHRPRQGEACPNSGSKRHLARKSGLDPGFGRGARRGNKHAGNQARQARNSPTDHALEGYPNVVLGSGRHADADVPAAILPTGLCRRLGTGSSITGKVRFTAVAFDAATDAELASARVGVVRLQTNRLLGISVRGSVASGHPRNRGTPAYQREKRPRRHRR